MEETVARWAAVATAISVLLTLGWRFLIRPTYRIITLSKKQWDKVDEILEAIRPTNGDSRSISDRVDTIKASQVAIFGDIEGITQRQLESKATTEELVRRVNDHIHETQASFLRISKWTHNFKEFDPIHFRVDPDDNI